MTNERSGDVADATLREFASGQKLFGRYTLIKILGRGGMGIVWLARDEELEREVALKFFPDLIIRDSTALNELKRETKRCLELTHPHIVRVYDFVHDERSGCISMEYIDGETLASLRCQKEQEVFKPSELSVWVGQLCDALQYAHNRRRIIHRDLKPANLMVNRRGNLRVSDFGIARSLGDSLSRLTLEQQGRSGTLIYMSPQQLDGERGTPLDDIYSLGATLYDLLTSKPPFYSGNIDRQVHEKITPSMTERRKEFAIEPTLLPPVWEETVAACLAKDPARRPQSARPLLEARLRERPDDTFAMTALSWVYLALGRNAEALRISRQAADSISIEKDALAGPIFQNGLAQIEARAGAPEEAVKRLRRLLSIPAGYAVSIARLKIDPVWDPIRNRPDFQQLLLGPEQIGPNK